MNERDRDLQLRMELLRLRGQMQRADAQAAWADVRGATRGVSNLLATVIRVGSAARDSAGWAAPWLGALRDHPWTFDLVRLTWRSARRHPVAAAVVAAAAVAAGMLWRSRRQAGAEDKG